MFEQEQYDRVMRDALQGVFVVAARRGFDTRQLAAEFDLGRDPGPHNEHTLTIQVRNTSLTVTAPAIPHDWLSTGTDLVDPRFSRLIMGALADLAVKAELDGRVL